MPLLQHPDRASATVFASLIRHVQDIRTCEASPHLEETRSVMVKSNELPYLRRCVELAAEALAEGDEPFGSVLVGEDGEVLAEDHNRVASGDRPRHPEFELARWSAAHLTPEQRAAATVYASGEH